MVDEQNNRTCSCPVGDRIFGGLSNAKSDVGLWSIGKIYIGHHIEIYDRSASIKTVTTNFSGN